MPTSHRLSFRPAKKPISELIDKFGGQPVWLEQPEWPLSRSTGKPMQFIGQFSLQRIEGYQGTAQFAYLFMSDDGDEYIDGTWEPEGGENCLLLQPGNIASVTTNPIENGPGLYAMKKKFGRKRLSPVSCEFHVDHTSISEPEFLSQDQLLKMDDADGDRYVDATSGNKIGGVPGFLQNDEFPSEPAIDWLLALQLDSGSVPFHINFGDAGIGYAFVKADGSDARFLWQCC
ncbi:DUF1963 domain-containing protein [Algisphaera agarilytica]|uniref:Uncharacterized protein YwqG n=1 Tax=Algisphaera agarilytica TaxID=1385975 RepID=A0A7X0H839_9BACT|nr:DUF1963 domain-containing protein [Algisphaera agarilytica]MBB6430843.1 uncharacterized protein YwqG [Algisphaera agarilytica]